MARRKKDIILEKLLVEDYAAEGKSLARHEGKVIFIENVIPGDVVDVRLGKNKKDWAEGYPLRVHSYSRDRVEPFCQHFGVCGGCQWQMLPYEKQLFYKNRQVKDVLQRIGKVAMPEMMPIIGAKETRHYRNKIEYTFGNKRFLRKEELHDPNISSRQDVAGFHAKGMFDKIVDIQTCYLQAEPTNAIRLAIKEFALRNKYTFYDIREHHGLLRTMQVRLCTTGELMVNIVFGEDDKKKRIALLDHVLQLFPSITTLLYTINLKKNDSLHDLEPIAYHGKGYVIEKLSTGERDYHFKIGPKSFFQTNTLQGEQLYRITRDFAELSGNEIVYDLYCGTGSIGIFVSDKARKIVGVEMIAAAIEDAKENAALNNLASAEFYAGDVIDICTDEFFAAHGRPDVIITDPPRAGMHEKLVNKILEIAAPTVVYVSCNPATQARDLGLLDAKYAVTKIQPVDMFPHTLHIENVVQLKLK
ncbi:MAG TPA: 23S rRNA (uracil(1939)-C(5))-methyltransferase RlmD [Chitinophagaceae bacterium]|nr:23S rRNA (uracil(1939)-C(5))-methyltransferase RlmD [Chitinophagaceae bacterium]